MSKLTVGSIEGLTVNSNVISVPTGHTLNVTDAAGLQIGGTALGTAVAFTPTWQVGFTVGNATEEWYYIRIGDFVHVYGNTLLGSTSAVTGSLQMAYPVAREALTVQFQILGTAMLFESGVGYKLGAVYSLTAGIRLNPLISSGTYLAESNTAATVPFAWAAGDAIGATFTYKAD
jgi:hypothetical protein